ncbi:hypothetical protein ACLOJK_008453 [Asimina triloba]
MGFGSRPGDLVFGWGNPSSLEASHPSGHVESQLERPWEIRQVENLEMGLGCAVRTEDAVYEEWQCPWVIFRFGRWIIMPEEVFMEKQSNSGSKPRRWADFQMWRNLEETRVVATADWMGRKPTMWWRRESGKSVMEKGAGEFLFSIVFLVVVHPPNPRTNNC